MEELDALIGRLKTDPASVPLFRGERRDDNGLHFSTDEAWARTFGPNMRTGTLPVGSRVWLLTERDFSDAFERGLLSERALWDKMFADGYDAIVGHDAMNHRMLDVIVNPKHHARFPLSAPMRPEAR